MSFFDQLWPEKPDAYLSTWLKSSGRVRFFHTSEADAAEDYLVNASQHDDCYFGVGLLAQRPQRGRGAAKDVAFLSSFFMDWDILQPGGGAHAKTALPESIDAVWDFVSEIKLPPASIAVNSGNGLHTYHVFEKPLDLRTLAGRESGATALKEFQSAIIIQAKKLRGWDLDYTGDLARVLRWPGTLNHKSEPAKRVEIVQ